MERRELLRLIAAATGCVFCPDDALRAAASPGPALSFTRADIDFLDDVAETILPRTDTPGARDAGVGDFIARYSAAYHPPEHVALLKSGIADIDGRMRALKDQGFREASGESRTSLLTDIDHEAKKHAQRAQPADAPHYFTLMKQLTLFGFFTSEPGSTRVARYRPVPGKYQGCIPLRAGETFWAW